MMKMHPVCVMFFAGDVVVDCYDDVYIVLEDFRESRRVVTLLTIVVSIAVPFFYEMKVNQVEQLDQISWSIRTIDERLKERVKNA